MTITAADISGEIPAGAPLACEDWSGRPFEARLDEATEAAFATQRIPRPPGAPWRFRVRRLKLRDVARAVDDLARIYWGRATAVHEVSTGFVFNNRDATIYAEATVIHRDMQDCA